MLLKQKTSLLLLPPKKCALENGKTIINNLLTKCFGYHDFQKEKF